MLRARQASVPLHIPELIYSAPRELVLSRLVVTMTGVSLLRAPVHLLTTARTLLVRKMCFGSFGRLSSTRMIGRVGPCPELVNVVGGRQMRVPCVLNRDPAVGTPTPPMALPVGTPWTALPVVRPCYRVMATRLPCPVSLARLVRSQELLLNSELTAVHLLHDRLTLTVVVSTVNMAKTVVVMCTTFSSNMTRVTVKLVTVKLVVI